MGSNCLGLLYSNCNPVLDFAGMLIESMISCKAKRRCLLDQQAEFANEKIAITESKHPIKLTLTSKP